MEDVRVSAGLSGAGAERSSRFDVSSLQSVLTSVTQMCRSVCSEPVG